MIRFFPSRKGRRRNINVLSVHNIEILESRQLLTTLTPGEGFQQVAGDFDGDGSDDLFYWDPQTGSNTIGVTLGHRDGSKQFATGSDHLPADLVGVDVYTRYVAGDFDGDGSDDLFMWHPVTGQNRTFYSSYQQGGTFSPNTNEIDPRGLNGRAFLDVMADDFDGDNRADLFFWNRHTGENKLAYANGIYNGERRFSTITNRIGHNLLSGDRYHAATAGDFDGDGRADLLFWNRDSGENRTYFAFGVHDGELTFVHNSNEVNPGAVSAQYEQILVGDFDGDQRVDVLFWNPVTGGTRLAFANGSYDGERRFDTRAHVIPRTAVNGVEFHQMSSGDFDNDGRDDITFYHATTGNNQTAFALGSYDGVLRFDRQFHYMDPVEVDHDQRRLRPGANPVHVGWNDGVLYLYGTGLNNRVSVGTTKGGVFVDGGDQLPPADYDFHRIEVRLEGGNDHLINATGLPIVVRGGDGHDTIIGGSGNDRLYGDGGDDVLVANGGDDIVDGGDGHDHGNGGDGIDDVINCEDVINAESFEQRLAFRWAPVLYQDVDDDGPNSDGGRSDYISRIDFDGDWDTRNNWENSEHYPLPANAYYSVVTTASHWYIIYGFYHARDWSDQLVNRIFDQHENDMEGMLAIVKRGTSNGEPYGELQAIVTTFHQDFVSYIVDGGQLRPAHDPDLSGFRDAQDYGGILPMMPMTGPQGQTWHRPVLGQEAEGHGLLAFDIGGNYGERPDGGDTTWVRYDPAEHGAEPASPHNSGNVFEPQQITPYGLVNIFEPGGLWDHRFHRQTFGRWGRFLGDNGVDNAANAPWTWDDTSHWLTGSDDDGRPAGELAWDPASFADAWFDNEDFSRDYTDNPYRSDEAIVLHVNGFGGSPWSPVQGNSPHPQWGLQTRPIDANDVTGAHGIPQGHVHVANWNNFYGHGQPGSFEPQLEDGVCLVSPVLCGLLGVPDRYAPDPLTDDEFVADTVNFLNLYEGSDTVILIGHSFGADSLLRVVNQTNVEIDLLAISDPIGPFGTRAAVPDGVGHNVRYLYNRYQTEGVWPAESALAEIVGESVAKSYLSYASDAISNQARIDVPTASEGFFGSSHEYVPRSPEFRGEITRWDRWRANPGVDLGSISTQILSDGQQQRRTGSFPHCPPGLRCLVPGNDQPAPGFTITETNQVTQVSEFGSTDTFDVVLDAAPFSNVVLVVSADGDGEVRLAQSRLTFTPENWNAPQTVTVWGVDDAIVDGDQTTPLTISIDSDASDDAFDGLAEQVLDVVTADDDVAIEVELTDGVLTIRGTEADDRIVIREQAGVVGIDGLAGVYDRDLIERLQVVALGGDDEVRNLTNLPLHADGGAGRDTIHGGVADDRIDGGDGNDVIFGFAGADDLVGGGGHDLLVGHAGNDTLQGDSGEDVLKGGSGNDRLFGGADDDKLLSSSGDDVLFGEDGDDTLKAGTGTDELTGGPGNDSLYGHNGRDLILAGTGADTAIGGGGDDMVFGEAGDDRLRGGRGHDVLSGGTGEDDLDGGKGRDVMIAGEGADLVHATTADDIVVAGSTTLTRSELEVIRREWRSGRSFEERVGNIRDGSGAERRWNERAFLVAGRTVHNDDQVDTIISDNSGSDWVFASAQDEATIDQVFESLDVL